MAPTPPSSSFRVEFSNRTNFDISLTLPSCVAFSVTRAKARCLDVDANFLSSRSLTLSIDISGATKEATRLDSPSSIESFSIRVLNSTPSLSSPSDTPESKPQDPSLIDYLPIELPLSLSDKVWAIQSLPSIDSEQRIVVHFFPNRSLSCFLSSLSSNLPISAISLPGTHESLARYGFPISSCQSMISDVTYQLNNGIRYFDIRMVPKGEGQDARLFAYHGITDERITLDEVLKQCYDWLDGAGKNGQYSVTKLLPFTFSMTRSPLLIRRFSHILSEFIIMSLKQESGPNPPVFDNLLASRYIGPNRSRWFLSGSTIPTLSQVRGKIILFSRFGTGNQTHFGVDPNLEIGLHASKWPNSLKGNFSFNLPDGKTSCQVQDWYAISSIGSIPQKFELIKGLIGKDNAGARRDVLGIDYCNGSDFPGALPPLVAKGLFAKAGMKCLRTKGINERLGAELLERLKLKVETADAADEKPRVQKSQQAARLPDVKSENGNQWFKNKQISVGSAIHPTSTGMVDSIEPVAENYSLMTIFALDFFDEPKGTAAEYLPRLIVEANFEPGS